MPVINILVVMLRQDRCLSIAINGKRLFTWLPPMMSLVATKFVLSFPIWCRGWDLGLISVSCYEFSYLLFISILIRKLDNGIIQASNLGDAMTKPVFPEN